MMLQQSSCTDPLTAGSLYAQDFIIFGFHHLSNASYHCCLVKTSHYQFWWFSCFYWNWRMTWSTVSWVHFKTLGLMNRFSTNCIIAKMHHLSFKRYVFSSYADILDVHASPLTVLHSLHSVPISLGFVLHMAVTFRLSFQFPTPIVAWRLPLLRRIIRWLAGLQAADTMPLFLKSTVITLMEVQTHASSAFQSMGKCSDIIFY